MRQTHPCRSWNIEWLKLRMVTEMGIVCSKQDNDWGTFAKVGFPFILLSQYSRTINDPAISAAAILSSCVQPMKLVNL